MTDAEKLKRIRLYREHAASHLTGSPDAWVEERMRYFAPTPVPSDEATDKFMNALLHGVTPEEDS